MDLLIWIIASTFFVSLLGLSGVFSFFMKDEQLRKITYILTAFAVGALLGGAFLHLLPEALGVLSPDTAMLYALFGFAVFLLVETYFHWHLGRDCEVHPLSYLLLAGDAIHNFLDGLVMAGSFLVSVPFGIVTVFVIAAHELPEELGIFGVLVHGGFDKKKATIASFLVQCTAVIGGIAGYYLSESISGFSSALLPFAAGGFIYIAATGLIPEIHKEEGAKKFVSIALIFVGLLFMWAIKAMGAE
jgi:zinc and cadmium transporter